MHHNNNIKLSCQLEILGNVIQYTKAQAEQTVILKWV